MNWYKLENGTLINLDNVTYIQDSSRSFGRICFSGGDDYDLLYDEDYDNIKKYVLGKDKEYEL